mgnify:CR=1 FL=1
MRRPLADARTIAVFETRVLLADRTLWFTALATLVLVLYGLLNGLAQTGERERTITGIVARQAETERGNRDLLRQVMARAVTPDPFANPVDPASMGGGMAARHAIMPTTALSPLAFGQADLNPDYYRVTYRSKATFMYDGEIENPWNLLTGHFDLAFVLTYLFPLLIFTLTYNMLSAEREQGTLRMLLSQPLSVLTLLAGKLLPRIGALLACAVAVPVVVVLALRPESRHGDQLALLMLWAATVASYGLFWCALAAVVNAISRSSAANALVLIASWVVFVLVVPVLLNLAVGAAAPSPSRTELATRTRTITVSALARYNDLLSSDYKFVADADILLPKDGRLQIPERMQGLYLVQRDTDVELERLLEQFDRQLDAQQALVDRFGLLSPAIVMHEAMASVAGNGARRFVHFRDQVGAFHRQWKAFFEPKVLQGLAVTEHDLDTLPQFAWTERPAADARAEIAGRLAALVLPTLLLAALAYARLRHFRPI